MNRIKDLRIKNGWTQEELGRKLNVQKSAVSKYEKGIVLPSQEILKKLSAIFQVSVDYLLDNESVPHTPVYRLSNEETKLIDSFRKLNDAGQNALMVLMAQISGQTNVNRKRIISAGKVQG